MSFEITVVANPENRRASMFAAAVHARGGRCHILSWLDVMRGARPEEGALVRIDSFGENSEVASWMLDREHVDLGRVEGLERTYHQWASVLETFPNARYMTPPEQILAMFDKLESKLRMERAGLHPPRTYGLVRSFDELRSVLHDAGAMRAFVKPRHGSSASGVIALTMDEKRASAKTSVALQDGKLFNSLRIRHYADLQTLAEVVDLLGQQDELIVEAWVPKASVEGGVFDLRIVAIRDRAEHIVVRVSKSPMTNLHLGCARGDVAALQRTLGDATWSALKQTAIDALSAFPGALYAGVDVAITPDRHRITPFEVNAFGDLLPGVLDDEGRDTYTAELDAFIDS